LVQKEKVVAEGRQTEITSWLPTERRFKLAAGAEGSAVSVMTFFYPHWKAEVNGAPVDTTPTSGGLISLNVPAEESSVMLVFREPALNHVAFYISAAGWIILLFAAIVFKLTSYRKQL
jgi:hypothetical protein